MELRCGGEALMLVLQKAQGLSCVRTQGESSPAAWTGTLTGARPVGTWYWKPSSPNCRS